MKRRSLLGGLVAALSLGRIRLDPERPTSVYYPGAGARIDWGKFRPIFILELTGLGTPRDPTVERVWRIEGARRELVSEKVSVTFASEAAGLRALEYMRALGLGV